MRAAMPAAVPIGLALLGQCAAAAEAPVETLPNTGAMLARLVIAMIVALGLLAAVLWFIQRLGRRGIGIRGSDRPLRIIDKLSLGPKQGVCIVNACGRYLVLGVSEKEISVLMELAIEDEEAPQNFADLITASKGGDGPQGIWKDG